MGKRTYIKTKLRMGIIEEVYEDESFQYVSFYYNEGYCVLEEGKFLGILTSDTIEGYYDGTKVRIVLNTNVYEDFAIPLVLQEEIQVPILKESQEITAEVNVDFFEVPCRITTACVNDSNLCLLLDFIGLEKNSEKQQQIENDLQKAGLI